MREEMYINIQTRKRLLQIMTKMQGPFPWLERGSTSYKTKSIKRKNKVKRDKNRREKYKMKFWKPCSENEMQEIMIWSKFLNSVQHNPDF